MPTPATATPREHRTFRHPLRIVGPAVVALTLSYLVAIQEPVPGWERSLTSWINEAPAMLADGLYPIMQLGTVWAPLAAAIVIAVWKRDLLLPFALLVGGLAAWFAAKGVKQLVGRDRPLSYVEGLVVREGDGTGLGYVSGHSAVAAVTAVIVMAALPRRARPVALVLAAIVGVARIVFGVHLPADVVGGWAVGALVGVAAVEAVDRLRPVLDPVAPPDRPSS